MYRIGIDIGGTFTDLVLVDGSGEVIFGKTPSNPEDQSIGVMAGLQMIAERVGLEVDALLGETERIVHGTTVATNALLERKGAKIGLLTTEGHRDVVQYLLSNGANPKAEDVDGETAATFARQRGFSEVAAMIEARM